MAKFGLVAYLMLATLAGPWLCCCAAASWSLPFQNTSKSTQSRKTCCGQVESKSDSSNRPVPVDTRKSPFAPCPCESGAKSPTVVVEANCDLLALRATQGEFADCVVLATIDLAPSHRRATELEARGFIHLTGVDVLRAHCRMRC